MNTGHTQMDTKICAKCGVVKELDKFPDDKRLRSGKGGICKKCRTLMTMAWERANPEKRAAKMALWRKRHPDRCLAQGRKWEKANPEKVKVKSARARKARPEQMKAATHKWHSEHPEALRNIAARWRKAHPDQRNAMEAARHATKLKATPAWADRSLIDATYTMAQAMTRLTGVKYHVDHIVPLRSKLVCGLHVGCNLQLLSVKENTSKGNRYWPDMP